MSYTPPSRLSIANALLAQCLEAQVNGNPAFRYSFVGMSEVSAIGDVEKPALFLVPMGESVDDKTRAMPRRWVLFYDLWILVKQPDSGKSAMSDILPIRDALDVALATDLDPAEETQSLGGLVFDARVVGRTEYFDGLQGNSAGVVVPVQIVTGDLDPVVDPS